MKFRLLLSVCALLTLPALLLPSAPVWSQTATQPTPQPTASSQKPSLLELAARDGHFTTLLKAIHVAELEDTLRKDGPFTVFAPTDRAFEELPKDELQRLMKDKKMLRHVLLYHVLSGRITAKSVKDVNETKTMADENLTILNRDGETYVQTARIVTRDLDARNGVIHVVDQVLMPSASQQLEL